MLGAAFVAVLAIAWSLYGCIPSSTLTEVIYVQDESYPVDLEAPKVIRNTPQAEDRAEDLPESNSEDDAPPQQEVNDLPQYNPNREESTSDDEIEQSKKKTGNTVNKSPKKEKSETGDDSDEEEEGDGEGQNEGDEGETDDSGGKTPDEEDSGREPDEEEHPSPVARDPGKSFSDVGNDDELPTGVKSVAAVGNAAIVTAALGGQDGVQNLVAADAHLLESQFTSVMASKLSGGYESADITAPVSIWSGDGSTAGSLSNEQLARLIDMRVDACLVTEGEGTVTPAQEQALIDSGVNVVYMPNMTTPDKIKACVLRIGKLLELGGDSQAYELATQYVSFHDDVMGHYSGISATSYTLYISDWESGVVYTRNSRRTQWPGTASDGVAVTRVGLSAQVPSTYLEAGGVVNAASQKVRFRQKIGKAIVWQVAGGTLLSEWYQEGHGEGVRGVTVELPSGSGFSDSSLMCIESSAILYKLGDDAFLNVVTRNENIKSKLDADRARANGLYAYYDPYQSEGAGAIATCISSSSYNTIVNPSGLFSSWSEGSMESVLESAWACERFNSSASEGGYLRSKTQEFYRTFYGYESANFDSDYAAIMDARYAE